MKKGSKVKIIKEQEDRASWMVGNNFYWGFAIMNDKFYKTTLKVGHVYEVLKARGVKGPSAGFIEVRNVNGGVAFVLKEDVEEVKDV